MDRYFVHYFVNWSSILLLCLLADVVLALWVHHSGYQDEDRDRPDLDLRQSAELH